jgi:hypothetical protein
MTQPLPLRPAYGHGEVTSMVDVATSNYARPPMYTAIPVIFEAPISSGVDIRYLLRLWAPNGAYYRNSLEVCHNRMYLLIMA